MHRIVAEHDQLGECPTWDDRAGRLVWIDVTGKRISSCLPDGSNLQRQDLPEMPGCFVMREGGGRVIAYRHRIAWQDADGAETRSLLPDGIDMQRERFNDGACDRLGRLWVGTMDRKLKEQVGGLYRVDADGASRRVDSGIGLGNGVAWSPGDDKLYHCDSRPSRIYVHDFDLAAGEVANRRVFVEFDREMGEADGSAMDVEGFLWVASPRASAVFRFDPGGKLERKIDIPTSLPSSICFGGPDARTLFITSLTPPAPIPGLEDCGAVFAAEAPVAGIPRFRFGG